MTANTDHSALQLAALSTGPIQENAVLVWDAASKQGFLIDPGDEAGKIQDWITGLGVQVQAILLTHAHFDHIGAVQPLRGALKVPVHLHERDLALYRSGQASAARWNLPFIQPADPEQFITQDQAFTAGALTLKARELPGHAPGHVVFVGDGFVIVGDTLFAGSVGRTDLPGGNHEELIAGIRSELLSLPDTTRIYPGHGSASTIGAERVGNPFLRD